MRHRVSRLLAASLFFSLVFHFVLGPLLVWLFGARLTPVPPAPDVVVMRITSSTIRHAAHTKPQPRHLPVQRPAPQARPVRQQRPQPEPKPVQPQPREVKRELARLDPRSINPPPAHAIALGAAQQQAIYERTIAKLRAENNPLISAARPVSQAAAPKHYTFDFSGVGTAPDAEGILTPVQSWHDGGFNYYYVRYWVQYADGSTETGIVPWPLRYRPSQDPFRLGLEHFPLPAPMADYVLPGGTNLHPLVAFCYAHREEFPNCPIEHE